MDKRARFVLVGGVLAALALFALHGVNKVFLGDRTIFSIDMEGSVATAYSAANFFAAGALALFGAAADPKRRVWWLLAGLLFMAFFVDDLAGVHEASEEAAESTSRLLLQPAVTLGGCTVLYILGRRLQPPARWLAWASAALFATGLIASTIDTYAGPPHVIYVLVMYVEELSEMLMATALLAAAFAAGVRVSYSPSTLMTSRLSRPPSNSV